MLIPIEEILEARARLAPYLPATPVKRAEGYSRRLDAAVMLKLELFQPTGAFKVRGALNALLCLDVRARKRGFIASSAGNHGLGLAYAAATLDSPATVVLPESAPPRRAALIERLGARVIVHGEDWNAANRKALELAEREALTYVSPFDDPAIMAGQGSIGLELLEQVPDLDVVVCAVGGGGLISGVASAVKALKPEVRVIGVETEGADCMARSLAAGRIVELERFTSIATSLGTKRTQERPFGIVCEAVERVEVVSDAEALEELFRLLDEEKLLVEPAASCTLAALVAGLVPDLTGAVVAPVMCGANVTLAQVLRWREEFSVRSLTAR
ncbi:MAG: threonine/serine dehydratase [Trueperaceae bacterium]